MPPAKAKGDRPKGVATANVAKAAAVEEKAPSSNRSNKANDTPRKGAKGGASSKSGAGGKGKKLEPIDEKKSTGSTAPAPNEI